MSLFCCKCCSCEDTGVPPFVAGQDHTAAPYRLRCQHEGGLDSGIYPFLHKKSSQVVDVWTPSLTPVPLPKLGQPNGGGFCDCSIQGGGPVTGGTVNWNSAFINDTGCGFPNGGWVSTGGSIQPAEQFNGTAQDLLTVQTFTKGSKEDLGACHAYGFKKYAAAKHWHGWYPWTWPTDGCTPYAATPCQVKYLETAYSINLEWRRGVGIATSYNCIGTIGGARSINASSGEITDSLAFTNSNSTYSLFPSPHYGSPAEPPTYTPGQSVDLANAFSSLITTSPHCGGVELNLIGIFSGTLENLVDTWNSGDPWNFDSSSGMFVPPATQITYTKNLCTSQSSTASPSLAMITVSWSRTDTVYTFSVNLVVNNFNLINCSGTITLSNPYYATIAAGSQSVEDDGENNLLIKWPLDGPEPWRHDQFTSIMPLVCRREVQLNATPIDGFSLKPSTSASFSSMVDDLTLPISDGTHSPFTMGWTPTYTQRAWFDPRCYVWYWASGDSTTAAATGLRLVMDGTIIGAPHPKGSGGIGWFDFYYKDIRFCPTDQGHACTPLYLQYNFAYGANLAEAEISLSNAGLAAGSLYYDNILPKNATHWTNNRQAHNIQRGAMIDLGFVDMGNTSTPNPATAPIYFIKAAFARLPVPSYNFFGPCGANGRTLIDENSAQYLNLGGEVAGVSVSPKNPLPSSPTLSTQRILIYGSAGSDGIYTGCTQAGGVLTLGPKVSQLPTGYTHPFVTSPATILYYTGICGILRFPSAWSLCGRQAVTFAADGLGASIVSFTAAQTGLWSGDGLDFSDTSMTLVDSNRIMSRFDAFQNAHTYNVGDCVFDGTNGQLCTGSGTTVLAPTWATTLLATTAAGTATFTLIKLAPNVDKDFWCSASPATLAGTVWAMSHGAPAWYWYDTAQKFDLRYGSWDTQQRASTVTFGGAQADCLPLSPCYPQVIAISPNSESWPNMTVPDGMGGTATVATGKTYWFGSSGLQSFTADGVKGSRVQANVEFDIPDLLYQTPACPPTASGNAFTCVEDDGTLDSMSNCRADQDSAAPYTLYYAPRPRMEACASPPGGAPSLPTDCFSTALTWTTMVQPPNPGTPGTSYSVAFEYCVLYSNELGSIPKNCRFNPEYYALTLGGGK